MNALGRGVQRSFGEPLTLGSFGAGSPATTGAPKTGGSSFLSSLGGGGMFGGLADIIGSLIGGQQQQAGFGDLEAQLRQAMSGQQGATTKELGLLQPFQQGGAGAFQQELAGLKQEQDPAAFINQALSQFQQSPAQKAGIQAGLTAVQNRAQAQGLGQSGAEQEALEQFAQQQTGTQQQQFLQNVLGLQQRRLSGLGSAAGLGFGAAQQGAGLIQGGQTNIADLLASLGQTQLGAAQAGAQTTQGVAGGIGSSLGGLASALAFL